MSYDEFKRCLRAANLTIKDLAALLDMQPNSITNYRAKGMVPRHLAVIATLLATLVTRDIDPVDVLNRSRAS
jgi:hypothetical protein